MFRFSMDKETPVDTNANQLIAAGISEDKDFAQRLRNAGEYKEGERYYRAENKTPKSVREAVGYVQGIFFHPPARVWLDEELHEVTAADLAAADKPST